MVEYSATVSTNSALRLSYAVQHHPDRGELLARLLSRLGGAELEVVTDPDPSGRPNPWRTYKVALETTPEWATHRVIIQDDALLCDDLEAVLPKAVAAYPDKLICLCVCGEPSLSADRVREAHWTGRHWAILDLQMWVPVIGLVWPKRLIAPALVYADEQAFPEQWTADDEIVARIMRAFGEDVYATVPSLVEHDDAVPSLKQGRPAAYGTHPGRTTAVPVPGDVSPLSIVWTV